MRPQWHTAPTKAQKHSTRLGAADFRLVSTCTHEEGSVLSRFTHRACTPGATQTTFAQLCPALQHERHSTGWPPHTAAHPHSRDALREHGDAGRHTRARAARANAARAAASQARHIAAQRTPSGPFPAPRASGYFPCTKAGVERAVGSRTTSGGLRCSACTYGGTRPYGSGHRRTKRL